MTEEQKQEQEPIKNDIIADYKNQWHFMDKNEDGCVDKHEFKAANEMEGPPPEYSGKEADMSDEEMEQFQKEQAKAEFDNMDSSGDGQISKQEAYAFANEGMPQADIDNTAMDGFFDDSDKDDDGFLSFDEFYGAGEEIEGDGKGKFLLKRKKALNPKTAILTKNRLQADIRRAMRAKTHLVSKKLKKSKRSGDEPAGDAPAGEAEAPAGEGKGDNFQDEIVDQADPEFDMVSGGDDCISWDDVKSMVEAGFTEEDGMTEEQKQEQESIKNDIIADYKNQWHFMDKNEDGCVDKQEFKAANEMEGPPPEYSGKEADMSDEEMEQFQKEQAKAEFDNMDSSGDGQISKQEAYAF